MVAISSYLCSVSLISGPKGQQRIHQRLSQTAASRFFCLAYATRNNESNQTLFGTKARQELALASTKLSAKSSESEEKVPSWAKTDSDEPPPWARDEGNPNALKENVEFPFIVYLLASAVTAIAAVGSIFEYTNQNPVFGLLNSDSIFYAPVLGFFAFTGIPTSAFLWYKSVQVANKEAEEQDRKDGYK